MQVLQNDRNTCILLHNEMLISKNMMPMYFIYLDLLRTLLYFIEMHVHSIVKIKSYSKLKIILYHIVNLPAVLIFK